MPKKPKILRSQLPTSTETASVAAVQPPAAEPQAQPVMTTASAVGGSNSEPDKAPEAVSKSPEAAPEVKPQPAPKVVVAAPQRTSGAGWFIPPQGPSGFGVKKD